MIGKMGQYDGNPYAMYIHGIPPFRHQKLISGYVSSRLNRLMKSEDEKDYPRVCVTGSRGSHPTPPPPTAPLTFVSRRPPPVLHTLHAQLQLPFRHAPRHSNPPLRRRRKDVCNATNN